MNNTTNMILSIHPEHAANILHGLQTVELRRRIPAQLAPGATIYLYANGHIQGHVTFAGLNIPPPPGTLRDRWLHYIASPAAMPTAEARAYLDGAKQPCALLLRYPVAYDPPHKLNGTPPQSFRYTTKQPTRVHPSVANYLLYLRTHTPQP